MKMNEWKKVFSVNTHKKDYMQKKRCRRRAYSWNPAACLVLGHNCLQHNYTRLSYNNASDNVFSSNIVWKWQKIISFVGNSYTQTEFSVRVSIQILCNFTIWTKKSLPFFQEIKTRSRRKKRRKTYTHTRWKTSWKTEKSLNSVCDRTMAAQLSSTQLRW